MKEESQIYRSFSEYSRFRAGMKKYGYNSKFTKEYESLCMQLRHNELDELCDKWNIPSKYLKTS